MLQSEDVVASCGVVLSVSECCLGGAFGAFCRDAACMVPTTKDSPGTAACRGISPMASRLPECGVLPGLCGICFQPFRKTRGAGKSSIIGKSQTARSPPQRGKMERPLGTFLQLRSSSA